MFVSMLIIAFLLSAGTVSAQTLYVNHHQQLILQFPAEVKYVDFGSSHLRGRQLRNPQYVCVQAQTSSLPETTLSVVTATGKYYSYSVQYREQLPGLVYEVAKEKYLPSTPLYISAEKTTHFVASHPIFEWAAGSDTLLVATASGIENILRLKARSAFQLPSSIALLSPQGEIASYIVHYSDSISYLSEYVGKKEPAKIQFRQEVNDTLQMQNWGKSCLQQKYLMNHCGVFNHKMTFSLVGIYSHEDQLLFRFVLQNRNEIDYAIDFMKVYIQDKKNAQYAALQEMEIVPFYAYSADARFKTFLPARQQTEFVLFFQRFTIPKERVLTVELFEKNGGRHLQFSISHKDLLRAKRLPLPAPTDSLKVPFKEHSLSVGHQSIEKKKSHEKSVQVSYEQAPQPKTPAKSKNLQKKAPKKEPSWEEDSFW